MRRLELPLAKVEKNKSGLKLIKFIDFNKLKYLIPLK